MVFLRVIALLVILFIVSSARAQDITMVPVVVDGQSVRLEMRIYKSSTEGKVPTLVFNHGSTGNGRDPSLFTKSVDFPQLVQFFVQRGWAVVMPSRRGRGGSEGEYDEGFAIDRSRGYTCDPSLSIAGADRALRDMEAAMATILTMPFVDPTRIVIGGVSRGGILSVAYAGQHPQQVKGVINFVGGWVGYRCKTVSTVNQEIFKRGSRYPGDTIWLYGDWDFFYPLFHSRENYAAFQAAGGKGTFHEFTPPPGVGGHGIVAHPDLWGSALDAYLKRQNLVNEKRRSEYTASPADGERN
jgi:pimeloyl-ACP methyl ester carboxylesterase